MIFTAETWHSFYKPQWGKSYPIYLFHIVTRRDGKLVTRNDGRAAIALPSKGGFIDSVLTESQSIYSPPKCTKYVQVISVKIDEKRKKEGIFTKK